ncbi:NAD(P)-binding domain-containing protein [Rhodococcus sp. LB1]|uniref:NAD(P)-binding domain-containing protein n=1 Tax=Rhodococcus sp. LB1 TaxID=1807499 RepID=UPI0009EE7BFC|nr:NAD(P)-binding domain-containing protein [Rhodococcus sp. LB1]
MAQAESDAHRCPQVVVVGLGGIGGGIAARMAQRGRSVIGMDVDDARVREWQEYTGSRAVSSFAGIDWGDVRCMVIAVRTVQQVEAVLSDDSVRSSMEDGASAFIVTTMTPSDARRVVDAHRAWRLFELPVSGGEVRAREGELTGLITGPPPSAFEEALLQDVFAKLFPFDEFGQPSLLKLINNTLAARNVLSAAVALATAHEQGVDASIVSQVIRVSSGSSAAGDALATLSDNQVDLLLKDARLLGGELPSSPFDRASMNELISTVSAARGLLEAADPERTRS